MELAICAAAPEAMNELVELYEAVAEALCARGLAAFCDGACPSPDALRAELAQGAVYTARVDERLVGAFALSPKREPAHAYLTWRYGVKPVALRFLAVRPDSGAGATGARRLAVARAAAPRLGYDSLRTDAPARDALALTLLDAEMARRAGDVCFDDSDGGYVCFEAPLSDDCPLLPIPMRPAYRHGDDTPWGGDGLKTLFHNPIPDSRTGEALEVSAIHGFESVDDADETLSALIARHGARLVGNCAEGAFPLLLKLISARDALSVQVHPGDAYAARVEGKLGKSEAWVILRAEAGASIRYGMVPGATRETLCHALDAGEDIAPQIACVPVAAGDVFYIPSGLVHAIGGGVTLYEIQQSSDVTYRLWDYNRVNAQGEKRPLHISKALDVLDFSLAGQRTRLPDMSCKGVHALLRVPAFSLDCCCLNGLCELTPHPSGFRMLTALDELLLQWEGDALEIEAGASVLLPAACPPVALNGVGRCLVGWAS